ncbi:hypothetical protein [Tenacibaculum xiamenense]|uniref:hypothetical protein n=1 Tax=Tenacibaculum xiamenense TaxID=1261553 RepID=UPI003893A95F
MKKLLTIITLIFLTNLYSQKKFPQHSKLEGINGKPKKVIEFIEIKLPKKFRYKYIHYYDKNGYIQKTETYTAFDDDEYELSTLMINKRVNKNTFKSNSYNGYYENLSGVGTEKFIDNTIYSEYKIETVPLTIASTKKLDKKYRIVEWTNSNKDTETNEIKYNTSKKFIYHKNRVSKIIAYNGKENTTKTLFVRNEKLDKHGNFLYQEYVTEDSELQGITKREYVYY